MKRTTRTEPTKERAIDQIAGPTLLLIRVGLLTPVFPMACDLSAA